METALFGRMRVGRCITSDAYLTALQQLDPTSLGCSADVLSYFDRVCSGRSTCDVSVASQQLYEFRPCPGQLMMYLEADYSCLTSKMTLIWYFVHNYTPAVWTVCCAAIPFLTLCPTMLMIPVQKRSTLSPGL